MARVPEVRGELGAGDSLVACLRFLLLRAEATAAPDALGAALGLGAAMVGVPGMPPRWWQAHLRDRNLLAAAALFGLRVRDLHPPAAAAGLERSAEFGSHFRDSYVPLMLRAIEHGQELLAWRGWSAPAAPGEGLNWGVVLGCDGDNLVGFVPCHPDSGEEAVSRAQLAGPAHQVYVVEDRAEARQPAAASLYDQATRSAQCFWAPAPGDGAIVVGAAAYGQAEVALRAAGDLGEWIPALRQLADSRRSLGRWLTSVEPELPAEVRRDCAAWRAAVDEVTQRLDDASRAADAAALQRIVSAVAATEQRRYASSPRAS